MRDLALTAIFLCVLMLAVYRPFVGILMWSWISFMNPHRLAWGFASEQPWAMLAFLATVIGCVLAREPRRPAVNGVTMLLALFLACMTLTSLTAIGPSTVVWNQWDRTLKIIIGLLLTAAMLTDRTRIHALVWLMVISLGYFGVRGGLFTLMTGGGFIVLGPPDTMINDRNHLAVALLVALPLMNYLRLHSRHHLVRLGIIAAMVLTLFAVVGSQSRGALVGLVATAALLWLRSRGKIVSGMAMAAALAAALTFMPDSWVQRMESMRSYQEDGSAMGRIQIWNAAWLLALARPLLGGGFRAIYSQDVVNSVTSGIQARATHSIWFEALADHGFPTFFVWLSIILVTVYMTLRITRMVRGREDLRWAGDLARMSQASIVAYCAGGTFLSLSYWDYFWTLCVVIAATHTLVRAQVAGTERVRAAETPAPAPRWGGAAGIASARSLGPARR